MTVGEGVGDGGCFCGGIKTKRKVPPSCSRADEGARSLTGVGMTRL